MKRLHSSLLAMAGVGLTLSAALAVASPAPSYEIVAVVKVNNTTKNPVQSTASDIKGNMVYNYSKVSPTQVATFEASGTYLGMPSYNLTLGKAHSAGSCVVSVAVNGGADRNIALKQAGDGSEGFTCVKQGNTIVVKPV